MTRNQILQDIKAQSINRYKTITNWVHDIYHIKTVVKNGQKLAKMESLSSKDTFLLEISCWLHDLGRVGEKDSLNFNQSSHAEVSYQISKKMLKRYEKKIGRESIFKILIAVREHSLPVLKHKNNKIAQLLQDADRGAGIDIRGIYTMLNYFNIVQTRPIRTKKDARRQLSILYRQIVSKNRTKITIEKLNYLLDWYYGTDNQSGKGIKVLPLHSNSAKTLYLASLKEIENFINKLKLSL